MIIFLEQTSHQNAAEFVSIFCSMHGVLLGGAAELSKYSAHLDTYGGGSGVREPARWARARGWQPGECARWGRGFLYRAL